MRILGVFAHPDDETFCAGGTLAKYAAAGAEVLVVSATRGQAGQIRDATVATRRTLGSVREHELRLACSQLGVRHVRCLDYMDGTLDTLDAGVLAEEILGIICTFRPDIVITFEPSGAYGHPDHIAISAATTDAFRRAHSGSPDEPSFYPPERLYYGLFGQNRVLLVEELVRWLIGLGHDFRVDSEYLQAMAFFAKESATLRYAGDHVDVSWYAPGTYIIEQGEVGDTLYLVLSGTAEIVREDEVGRRIVLGQKVAGQFFGELALAHDQPRTAHVIAVDGVTCLALSRHQRTAFDGRGTSARIRGADSGEAGNWLIPPTTCIDVSDFVDAKIAAIASHRTQYPMRPDMFPRQLLRKMLGEEAFVRVYPPVELATELHPRLAAGPVAASIAEGVR